MESEDYNNDREIILRRDSVVSWVKSFTKREKLFFILNCVTLLTTFVLIILLGASKSHDSYHKGEIVQMCLDGACLEQATFTISNMNQSVNPCEDFYTFACGKFSSNYPPIPVYGYNDLELILEEKNIKKIRKILEKPVPDNQNYPESAEKKIKALYKSCINSYGIIKLDGHPLLQMIQDLGGWYLLETWDEAHFNKNIFFQKVRIDHCMSIIFQIRVTSKQDDSKQKKISIYSDGLVLYPSIWYTDTTDIYQDKMDAYKSLISNLSSLLMRDSKVPFDDTKKKEKITTFINDVMTFEIQLANISQTYGREPTRGVITLAELNVRANVFDWISLFKYMFSDDTIFGSTELHCDDSEYLIASSQLVKTIPNRMFHNYLIWRLIIKYGQSLSYEYAHHYNVMENVIYQHNVRHEVWYHCVNLVAWSGTDIVNALFIEEHFSLAKFDAIYSMAEQIKRSTLDIINHFPWMDEMTRSTAKKKVNSLKFMIGFSPLQKNRTVLDGYYKELYINETNFFDNWVNINKFCKTILLHMLMERENMLGFSKYLFHFMIFNYNPFRNEISIPAGLLQSPLYNNKFPIFVNYANLGFILAKEISESFLKKGRNFDENGLEENWWSNETAEEYEKKAQCLYDQINQKIVEIKYNGTIHSITIQADDYSISLHLNLLVSIMQVYKSYKLLMAKEKLDSMLPGIHVKNIDQGFFLSLAQSACLSETEEAEYTGAKIHGEIPMKARFMHLLSQIPEFSDAFQCSPLSNARKDASCNIIS